jgi:hypothetical protein
MKLYGNQGTCGFFIDTFVSFAIPSLQLRLTTSLFSNLDSTLKTNTQYLSIVQCWVLVLICSHILLCSYLAQIPLAYFFFFFFFFPNMNMLPLEAFIQRRYYPHPCSRSLGSSPANDSPQVEHQHLCRSVFEKESRYNSSQEGVSM